MLTAGMMQSKMLISLCLSMVCSFTLLFASYNCELVWAMRNAINRFAGFDPSRRVASLDFNLTNIYAQLDLRERTPICQKLFRSNSKAHFESTNSPDVTSSLVSNYSPVPEEAFVLMSKDCVDYKKQRGYVMSSSASELKFPIAYSVLLYRDIELTERLLRAIYRPQNVYCLHVDRKADVNIHEAAASIASCFENVFLVPSPVSVSWGTSSVIEAELSCMHLLWSYKQDIKWKYFINLTGQEYPLKTNAELVKILRAFRGANDIQFQVGAYNKFKRRTSYRCNNGIQTEIAYREPPAGMRIAVGSTHMAVSREFVDYVLHNSTAKVLLEWVKNTCIPDETYFNMLNVNPQLEIPGSYMGDPQISDVLNAHFTRFKVWKSHSRECKGIDVRNVCIMNIHYLPELKYAREMFVNKFHLGYHPLAIRCLEELIYDRTLKDVRRHSRPFDVEIYRRANFVKHSYRPPGIMFEDNISERK